MLYYDKKWCKIYYHDDIHCVHLDWFGYANMQNFQEACNASLDLLMEKKVSKMIADNSKAKIVSVESQKWLLEKWFGEAYKEGYRTSAVVESDNIFNEVAVKNIVNQMDDGKFTVHYFNDLEKAKQWLKEFNEELV